MARVGLHRLAILARSASPSRIVRRRTETDFRFPKGTFQRFGAPAFACMAAWAGIGWLSSSFDLMISFLRYRRPDGHSNLEARPGVKGELLPPTMMAINRPRKRTV
jgi:hypothetical protein